MPLTVILTITKFHHPLSLSVISDLKPSFSANLSTAAFLFLLQD